MRIAYNALLLDRGEYSGVHVTVRELLSALVRTRGPGDELVVYARRSARASLGDADGADGVRLVHPRFPVRWRTGRILWEQFRLPGRVWDDRADVLHCPGYVMPRLCLLPTVATVHDLFALAAPQLCTAANRSHFHRMLPPTLVRARRVAVPTEAVRRDLLRWAAANRAKGGKDRPDPDSLARRIRVVPWGVSGKWRPLSGSERDRAKAKRGWKEPFFLVVARPEPKKNLELAVKAWFAAALSAKLPHRLVFAGPRGWGVARQLRATVANLGVSDRVTFLGFVDDAALRLLYGEAEALLVPSWSEGFGLPVLEAMACGCPVVASEIPALVEVAGRGNARFARPDDPPAWREAIELLAANKTERKRLAAAGRERSAAFTWERTASAYWELYREAAKEME